MAKLEPEITDKLKHFLDQGYITGAQIKLLKAYFKFSKRSEAAKSVGIKIGTFGSILSELTRRGVLVKVRKGCYQLTEDESQIKTVGLKIEFPPDKPLEMSKTERTWMLENYTSNNRSEAARKLGRSKFDICRMAMALGIDRKN